MQMANLYRKEDAIIQNILNIGKRYFLCCTNAYFRLNISLYEYYALLIFNVILLDVKHPYGPLVGWLVGLS